MPDQSRWYGTNVAVSCTARDLGSGLAEDSPATFSLETSVPEGEETTSASTNVRTVTDRVGHLVTVGPYSFMVDRKAPTVSCSVPEQTTWYPDNVTVTCNAHDDGSGLADGAPSSFDLSTTVGPGEETASAMTDQRAVSDTVGNSVTVGPYSFRVDRKAPVVTCSVPDPAVWYPTNVTVTCTASDAGSRLADPSDANFVLTTAVASGEETSTALTGSKTVVDGVGHATTAGPYTFKIDKKAPEVSCEPTSTPLTGDGWYGDNVTVECTASDGGSGLADTADASFTLSTAVPAGQESNGALTGTRFVRDAVGNSVTVGPYSFKIDRKGPVLTLSCPTGLILQNATSVATWSATDGGSGVAGSTSGGVPLDTATVGTRTLTLPEGFVRDNVGNPSASVSCSFIVIYRWNGFFAPVDNPPVVNVAKAGSAIPLKFSLGGYQGMDILAAGSPKGVVYPCSSAPTDELTETTTAGASGLQYDPTTDQYIYVWKTNKSWVGKCYKLVLTLKDGTTHEAYFRFK